MNLAENGVRSVTINGAPAATSSSWDRPLRLRNSYLWLDTAGALRIKAGTPASDEDGARLALAVD